MKNVTLTINGKTVRFPAQTSILDACTQQGIDIPTLCHHPELKPYGACRLCIVEDNKTGRIFASCVTPVSQDMEIMTHSERVIKHRRNIIRLMMAEHPESCLVCSKGNKCQLRNIAAQLGVGESGLYPMHNYKGFEQANPFISRDLSKCIFCGKCVRADHELVAAGAIDYNHRGFDARPATLFERPLEESECTFCGTCVSVCPTGALFVNNSRFVGTPQKESESVCGFCSAGCSISLGVSDNKVVEVNPSSKPDSVNGVTLCVRGHFAHDYLNSKNRLTTPLMRKSGEFVEVSWDEAISAVCAGLMAAKKENGPETVGFMGSSKCTNEENYLFQKIARVLLETNNIDNGGHFFGQSVAGALDLRTKGRFRKNPLSRLDQAQVIFIIGANPGNCVPVAAYYIKRAAQKGIPIIVADPLPTDLDRFASLYLDVTPGRDLDLLNGIAALLVEKHSYDTAYIADHTKGFSLFRAGVGSLDIQRAALICGVGFNALARAADLISGKKISFVVGQGILQQPNAIQTMDALVNLALMTGSLGPDCSGIHVLARENNQAGAYDMGCAPGVLAGRSLLSDNLARKYWERAWQTKISPDRGLSMTRMLQEAGKGNLKALYIMGENPARGPVSPDLAVKALKRADFVVVQDVLMTKTAQLADVILPGAPFSEKSGSFTNFEGRIQSFGSAALPPDLAKSDWKILAMVAQKLGLKQKISGLDDIKKEIADLVPIYGENYLKNQTAWTCNANTVHKPISFAAPISSGKDKPDAGFGFTAILGSIRPHLGSGTRTSHSERISSMNGRALIEMSAKDAASLGIKDGDPVQVVSKHGQMTGFARLLEKFAQGLVRVPVAVCENSAARLIGMPCLDDPELGGIKTFQVNLEKINERGKISGKPGESQ